MLSSSPRAQIQLKRNAVLRLQIVPSGSKSSVLFTRLQYLLYTISMGKSLVVSVDNFAFYPMLQPTNLRL